MKETRARSRLIEQPAKLEECLFSKDSVPLNAPQIDRLCAGFSDAGIGKAGRALVRPASEKRQGTKSRWVGQRRRSGLYGDLATSSDLNAK